MNSVAASKGKIAIAENSGTVVEGLGSKDMSTFLNSS
jgi:hypothetical protein